ncbi:MAG: carboxypeptidase-like regulatory domain-containing protein [Planctomycetota bacterium]|nr:carboxypeptidase-like regulatory domain-containing protein [Planctomycetota bacterium]
MTSDDRPGDFRPEILEQNLVRLFRASWRPVTPSARFAADLRARLEAESVRPAPRSIEARRVPTLVASARRVRLAAAFLALVAGLTAAWFLLRGAAPATSADTLLAAGHVAVQDDPDGTTWRAASSGELARGIEIAAHAACVATPAEIAVTVHLGTAGRVEVDPRSRVTFGAPGAGGQRDIALDGSSARVRRDDAGEPWRLAMPGGVVALARGILQWSRAANDPSGGSSLVQLAAGIAWVATEDRADLMIGQRVWLRDGRIALVGVLTESGAAATSRTPAAPGGGTDDPRPPDAAAAAPVLTGTLVLPSAASAPASFRVTLLRRERLPAVSQPETATFRGSLAFAYEKLRAGTYDVYIEAPGFAVASRSGIEITDGSANDLRFELAPSRSVSGVVRDAATGAPIAGATVLAETRIPAQVLALDVDAEAAGWSAATRTRADGSFTLDGLDAEPVTLRVSAAGHAATWVPDVAARAATTELAPVELAAGGAVAGRVSRPDGSPWPRAIVIASRIGNGGLGERMSYGMAQCTADGDYRIDDLPPGEYVVFSFDPSASGTPATRDLRIRGTELARLDLGATDRRTRLVGTVRDARGSGLAEMDVMLGHGGSGGARDSTWIATRTDAEGRFAFEGVDPKHYDLFVGRGLGTSFAIVDEVDVQLAPETRHDVTLAAGSLRGRVLSIEGAPAAGTWIIVTDSADTAARFVGRAQTDRAGSFEVLGLAPGTYAVSAHDPRAGVAAVRVADLVVGNETRDVELRFAPGVELRVRVVDAAGHPVAGRAVRFTDERGVEWQFSAEGTTDARGVQAVPGLAPGRWRVGVDGAGTQVLDLELGPPRDVQFRMEVDPDAQRSGTKEGKE